MSEEYSYFDSVYFQDGTKKGTVYTNYVEASRQNRTYKDIADTIVSVLRPKRCLEVGCATGIIVKYINELGCEAHGIDVSQWAVEHREHPNVHLAPAENLPFVDDNFDLVFSCHSLEHVPLDKKDRAFAEMTRVCSEGIQFHMLPIVGMGPYAGDPKSVIKGLRADPTHNLLFNKDRWISEWGRFGCDVTP